MEALRITIVDKFDELNGSIEVAVELREEPLVVICPQGRRTDEDATQYEKTEGHAGDQTLLNPDSKFGEHASTLPLL